MAEEPKDTRRLSTGREIPRETLNEITDSIVIQYAGNGFEDFSDIVSSTAQSLQEDVWEGIDPVLTYDEAIETIKLVEQTAREFTGELVNSYCILRMKYLGGRVDCLATKLRELLSEDILERYDNSEYWDWDVTEDFFLDEKLSREEIDAVMKIIRR